MLDNLCHNLSLGNFFLEIAQLLLPLLVPLKCHPARLAGGCLLQWSDVLSLGHWQHVELVIEHQAGWRGREREQESFVETCDWV